MEGTVYLYCPTCDRLVLEKKEEVTLGNQWAFYQGRDGLVCVGWAGVEQCGCNGQRKEASV